jgi:hypothetical protein
MQDQLTTVLNAIQAAQGVLRKSQTRSALAAEMLRDILCNPKVCAATRVLSCDHQAGVSAPARELIFARDPILLNGGPQI